MPRTKRPTKKPEKTLEEDESLKKLDKIVAEQKRKIDEVALLMVEDIKTAFKIITSSLSDDYLNMTMGQLKSELYFKEAPPKQSQMSARSASDDGYITENSSHGSSGATKQHFPPPSTGGRSASRRSRSADTTSRKLAPPRARDNSASQRRRSRSMYRTPACIKNAHNNYPVITPKVTPQAPMTVLRQPRRGEMVVSMEGSPVMVPTYSSMQPDDKANCNILLRDGTMLSLQPKTMRQSQTFIPFSLMDSNVLNQLRTLKENLDKVVRLGERAYK